MNKPTALLTLGFALSSADVQAEGNVSTDNAQTEAATLTIPSAELINGLTPEQISTGRDAAKTTNDLAKCLEKRVSRYEKFIHSFDSGAPYKGVLFEVDPSGYPKRQTVDPLIHVVDSTNNYDPVGTDRDPFAWVGHKPYLLGAGLIYSADSGDYGVAVQFRNHEDDSRVYALDVNADGAPDYTLTVSTTENDAGRWETHVQKRYDFTTDERLTYTAAIGLLNEQCDPRPDKASYFPAGYWD